MVCTDAVYTLSLPDVSYLLASMGLLARVVYCTGSITLLMALYSLVLLLYTLLVCYVCMLPVLYWSLLSYRLQTLNTNFGRWLGVPS